MLMKILTNAQYNAICDIVSDLQKENKKLKRELYYIQKYYMNFKQPSHANIDFPNSQKGGGHDIGNIDINDILNN